MADRMFQQWQNSLKLTPKVRVAIGISIGVTLIIVLCSLAFFIFSQPQIPLFYSLTVPSQQLVPNYFIFIISVLSLINTFTNIWLYLVLKKYDQLLTTLFTWSTLTIQFLFLFVVLRIIYITL